MKIDGNLSINDKSEVVFSESCQLPGDKAESPDRIENIWVPEPGPAEGQSQSLMQDIDGSHSSFQVQMVYDTGIRRERGMII